MRLLGGLSRDALLLVLLVGTTGCGHTSHEPSPSFAAQRAELVRQGATVLASGKGDQVVGFRQRRVTSAQTLSLLCSGQGRRRVSFTVLARPQSAIGTPTGPDGGVVAGVTVQSGRRVTVDGVRVQNAGDDRWVLYAEQG